MKPRIYVFDIHLIMTSWFIFFKMTSLVRRFIAASLKDQSSNKPLAKQIGPILKNSKTIIKLDSKIFFKTYFTLSYED